MRPELILLFSALFVGVATASVSDLLDDTAQEGFVDFVNNTSSDEAGFTYGTDPAANSSQPGSNPLPSPLSVAASASCSTGQPSTASINVSFANPIGLDDGQVRVFVDYARDGEPDYHEGGDATVTEDATQSLSFVLSAADTGTSVSQQVWVRVWYERRVSSGESETRIEDSGNSIALLTVSSCPAK